MHISGYMIYTKYCKTSGLTTASCSLYCIINLYSLCNLLTLIQCNYFEITCNIGECLRGLVVRVVYSSGASTDMVFGSIPSATYTTEGQIAGFHGIAGENCIKRLGVYTQMNSNELKGKHDTYNRD